MKRISLVFSFRNEEKNIPELISRTTAVLGSIEDIDYELIFVNDASTDGSLDLLLEHQQKHPIIIINMSRRFGVTPCVLAGFEVSTGDVVVYLDSDLQDPPELIPKLYNEYLNGSDVVHTTRSERLGESPSKMFITKCAYRIINFFSDIDLPENTGDFKLLSRKVVDRILTLREYDPYMRGLSIWVGYKQSFVEYVREPRFTGVTKMPLLGKGPVKEFLRGVTAYSAGPLYISIFVGIVAIFLSFLLAIYAIGIKILGDSASGVSSILIAIAFFSGAILFSNGLLGIYISKIYYDVKGRPKYIIDSVIK